MNKNNIIKWGIIGCGSIANAFTLGLNQIPDAKIDAVASKSGKSKSFGEKYGISKCYDNYDDLVNDDAIDIIYIATTHNFHYENIKLCLNHDKPVLCEKPFTVNAKQAEEVIVLSRKKKLFLMEGMWTRFNPIVTKVRELIHNQKILGDILHFKGDFGFNMPYGNDHRAFNPNLAGGSLLDLGVYPISFSSMVFKDYPSKIMSSAILGESGVDIFSSYLFEYKNGSSAMMTSSTKSNMSHNAIIFGSKGNIRIPTFSRPIKLEIYLNGKDKETIDIPFDSTGFQFEAMEANKCLNEGKFESDIMSLDETLEIMKIMDTLRSQWNLKYPFED